MSNVKFINYTWPRHIIVVVRNSKICSSSGAPQQIRACDANTHPHKLACTDGAATEAASSTRGICFYLFRLFLWALSCFCFWPNEYNKETQTFYEHKEDRLNKQQCTNCHWFWRKFNTWQTYRQNHHHHHYHHSSSIIQAEMCALFAPTTAWFFISSNSYILYCTHDRSHH